MPIPPMQRIFPNAALAFAALSLLTAPVHAASDEQISVGRGLFARHCASCHGPTGTGGGPDADLFPSAPRNLHDGFLAKYDDATLLRRIRDGRGLPLFLDIGALQRHSAAVEDLVAHIRKLAELDWTAVEPGWAAYVARCEVCHGPTGDGPASIETAAAPTDLTRRDAWKARTSRQRRAAMRHARAGMAPLEPPVEPQEAASIAAFVDLFSPGFSLFSRHCANCHADDGRGVATLGEVQGEVFPLPAVVFDSDYLRKTDAAELRGKVWHMLESKRPSMPHFRVVLGDDDVRAILSYLRASEPTPRPVP